MRINTNTSAITANNQLAKVEQSLSTSLERLSSGYKLNQASDNASGMAISLKMKLQIRGLKQSDTNAADGMSVIQTAEGALEEIQAMIERMKELTVQAANDVNSDEERGAIQSEINTLNDEINRITKDTDFNTQPLLDGTLSRRVYADNSNVNILECTNNISAGMYGIDIVADAEQAELSGSFAGFTEPVTAAMAGTITINGYDLAIKEGESLNTVKTNLNAALYNIAGRMELSGDNVTFSTNAYGVDEKLDISFSNSSLASAFGMFSENTAEGKDAEVTWALDDDGQRIGFEDTATITAQGNKITVNDTNSRKFEFTIQEGMAGQTVMNEVTDIGMMTVHVGANQGQQIDLDIPAVNSVTIGTDDINVMTYHNASRAITKVDSALTKVSSIRANLGAYENRLEHTSNNLTVSNENLETALSRITDTDMAEEMTAYTSNNVLVQAATSMLSQANQRPESVLQLLQK